MSVKLKSVANHVIGPPGPSDCACEPNYLTMRVDYSSFALSIELMSRELRKDSKPRWLFEQAEVRSQSQSAINPVPSTGQQPLKFRG